jgi:hypothetical protein
MKEQPDVNDSLRREGPDAVRNRSDRAAPFKPNGGAPTEPKQANDGPLFDPWARYIVPAFPLDVLPPVARDFVATQSDLIGCDVSALAMTVLTAFSGALDHRFALKMMRNGRWQESPRLWVLLSGDPSCRKSPVIREAMRPLEEYQEQLTEKYDAEVRDYEQAKAAGDENAKEPKPPPRFMVWDTTIEALAEILSRSPRGLLVKRDEFAGWIGGMEKYSGTSRGSAADRAFWLQSYDGGPYRMDRIKRGATYVRNLSISLIGGIQPEKLVEMRGLTSDGLLQRFLPVMMSPTRLPLDRPSDDEGYGKLVRQLIFAQPQRLILDQEALDVMEGIQRDIKNLEDASSGLANGFQSFVGKLPGYAGSLALILHMADNPEHGALHPIEWPTIEAVRRLILDFIEPHAFEFYRTTESVTQGDRLKKLASWILTGGKTRITASDLTANVADMRGLSLFEISKRMSPLVAGGWLEPVDATPNNRAWNVDPRVMTYFAKRKQIENERKAELARLIKRTSPT